MKNAITTTTKLINIIARFTIKRNGAVVYQVRSSKGTDIYTTTLVNGHATGCSCPAVKPCYHMTQLEQIEQANAQPTKVAPRVAEDWVLDETASASLRYAYGYHD